MKATRKLNTQEIYPALRQMIIALEVLPGSRVTETQLADYFAVSRSPIRAALQRLEKDGLLTVKPKQGCFIRNINMAEINQYYDVRVALENMVLAEISKRTNHDELRKLKGDWDPALTLFGVEIDEELKKAEEGFHENLAAISCNPVLIRYIADINEKIRVVRLLGWPDIKSVTDTYEQHYSICDYILGKNLKAAQKEMTSHIRNSQDMASRVTLQQLYNNRNTIHFE